MDEDEELQEAPPETEEPPPPPARRGAPRQVQDAPRPAQNAAAGQPARKPVLRQDPQGTYQRVRLKDVDQTELARARGKVVFRFMIGIIVTVISVICWTRFVVIGHPLPWKATDPANPRFNPGAFRFLDYQNPQSYDAAIRRLLPPGTPKQAVDRLLLRVGHAHANKPAAKGAQTQVTYLYMQERGFVSDMTRYFVVANDNERRWITIVTYDAAEKVVKVVPAIDVVTSNVDNYTNIAPERSNLEYWQ